jgi:hypothetical protein
MPFSLVQRLLPALQPRLRRLRAATRAAVQPPLARQKAWPWRLRLTAWLASGVGDFSASTLFHDSKPAMQSRSALSAAQNAFRKALRDIAPADAQTCLTHIRAARSLHEMWHLRAEVFSLVSRHRDQIEADRRLDSIDRHFPSRVRRTAAASKAGHKA